MSRLEVGTYLDWRDADSDLTFPKESEISGLLDRCEEELSLAGPPLHRTFSSPGHHWHGDTLRVLQWNVLAQGEY